MNKRQFHTTIIYATQNSWSNTMEQSLGTEEVTIVKACVHIQSENNPQK